MHIYTNSHRLTIELLFFLRVTHHNCSSSSVERGWANQVLFTNEGKRMRKKKKRENEGGNEKKEGNDGERKKEEKYK